MSRKINEADFRESASFEYLKEHPGDFSDIDFDTLGMSLLYLKTLKLTMKKLQDYFHSFHISPGKLTVLMALIRCPDKEGLLPSELSDRIGVTRGTITGLLDGLEKQGYIRRKLRSETDRRKIRIVLTGKGREFLRDFLPRHYKKMMKITEDFTEEDRSHLKKLLEKLEGNLERF